VTHGGARVHGGSTGRSPRTDSHHKRSSGKKEMIRIVELLSSSPSTGQTLRQSKGFSGVLASPFVTVVLTKLCLPGMISGNGQHWPGVMSGFQNMISGASAAIGGPAITSSEMMSQKQFTNFFNNHIYNTSGAIRDYCCTPAQAISAMIARRYDYTAQSMLQSVALHDTARRREALATRIVVSFGMTDKVEQQLGSLLQQQTTHWKAEASTSSWASFWMCTA